MADIVDVEEHNLDDIAEDLAEAGIDISDIELPQSSTTDDGDGNEAPPTVDEVVDGDGLLPFISPLSVIAIIALAGVVAGSRREEEC
jgi:hypothetical protein